MVRKGREHLYRDGMGKRLHGVRVSGEGAQQDQHDGGRLDFCTTSSLSSNRSCQSCGEQHLNPILPARVGCSKLLE